MSDPSAGANPTDDRATGARPGAADGGGGTLGTALLDQLGITAEWPEKAVDKVDLLVAVVTDKAVRPVVLAARAVVFGVVIAVTTVVLVVLFSVGFVRLLDVYVWPGEVWISYLVLGSLFIALGVLAYALRNRFDNRDG
jgi:hypothetical protein